MPMLQLLLLLIGVVSGLALLLGLWQLLVNRKLRRELLDLRRKLADRAVVEPPASPSFSVSLDQVERQHPTTTYSSRSSTEKYRYVASLVAQGMDVKGISAALQLAPAEVEQLMQLASLKHHQ